MSAVQLRGSRSRCKLVQSKKPPNTIFSQDQLSLQNGHMTTAIARKKEALQEREPLVPSRTREENSLSCQHFTIVYHLRSATNVRDLLLSMDVFRPLTDVSLSAVQTACISIYQLCLIEHELYILRLMVYQVTTFVILTLQLSSKHLKSADADARTKIIKVDWKREEKNKKKDC